MKQVLQYAYRFIMGKLNYFFFEGPAESVFNTTYFQMVKNALNSNGIHVTQGRLQQLLEITFEFCLF